MMTNSIDKCEICGTIETLYILPRLDPGYIWYCSKCLIKSLILKGVVK